MSTSTIITKKVYFPKSIARLIEIVPDKYSDPDNVADWKKNNPFLDFGKLESMTFEVITLYGSDIATFIQNETDSEWGSKMWEFDSNDAKGLLDTIKERLKEKLTEDAIDDLNTLKTAIENELAMGTEWFQVSIWY